MEIVVPLAGPDFERPDGFTKAEITIDGMPLLVRALTSRSWWRRGEVSASDLIFVLKDTECSRAFSARSLLKWFPGARVVYLSHPTAGAAFSAIAGVAVCDPTKLLCVDLADILYDEACEPESIFAVDPNLGGMVPVFWADNPIYSYVELGTDGKAIRTAEKSIISSNASAGTYFFRDASVYSMAVSHAIRNRHEQTYRDIYFICPLFNGVIFAGHDVRTFDVNNVIDIKI